MCANTRFCLLGHLRRTKDLTIEHTIRQNIVEMVKSPMLAHRFVISTPAAAFTDA